MIKPVFDKDVDTDDCIDPIGVMLTDDDNDDPLSPDFSSRGRFCFFFTGSPKPELSTRFPFESYDSVLFTFTLSQSVLILDNFTFFGSPSIEPRKFSFNKSSFSRCDDLNCPSPVCSIDFPAILNGDNLLFCFM